MNAEIQITPPITVQIFARAGIFSFGSFFMHFSP